MDARLQSNKSMFDYAIKIIKTSQFILSIRGKFCHLCIIYQNIIAWKCCKTKVKMLHFCLGLACQHNLHQLYIYSIVFDSNWHTHPGAQLVLPVLRIPCKNIGIYSTKIAWTPLLSQRENTRSYFISLVSRRKMDRPRRERRRRLGDDWWTSPKCLSSE